MRRAKREESGRDIERGEIDIDSDSGREWKRRKKEELKDSKIK